MDYKNANYYEDHDKVINGENLGLEIISSP